MNLHELGELVEKRKAEFGPTADVITMEYNGGDDALCDIVDLEYDEECGALRVRTVFR